MQSVARDPKRCPSVCRGWGLGRMVGLLQRMLWSADGLEGHPHRTGGATGRQKFQAFPGSAAAKGGPDQDPTSAGLVRQVCQDAAERAAASGLHVTMNSSVHGTIAPACWSLVSQVTKRLLWHSTECNMRGHLLGRIEAEVRVSGDRIEVAVEDDGWAARSDDEPYLAELASLLERFQGSMRRQTGWATNRIVVVLRTSPPGFVGMNCQCAQCCQQRRATAVVGPAMGTAPSPFAIRPGALP